MSVNKNKNKTNILTYELLNIYKAYFVDFMLLVSSTSLYDELTDEMIDLHNSVLELEDKLCYTLVQEMNISGDVILTEKGSKILIELLPLFVDKDSLH